MIILMEENKKLIEEATKDYSSIKPIKYFWPIFICSLLVAVALATTILYFMVFYK